MVVLTVAVSRLLGFRLLTYINPPEDFGVAENNVKVVGDD
jgi:hypothetical protein